MGEPMDCIKAQSRLGPLLDQELDSPDEKAVKQHLQGCEQCRGDFERLSVLADGMATATTPSPPAGLWSAIERRLDAGGTSAAITGWRRILRPGRIAAAIFIAVGLGTIAFFWPQLGEQRAEASTVQFQVLLDSVTTNPEQALRKFLVMYQGEEIRPVDAKQFAPKLSFELPDRLPGDFRLGSVFALRFGQSPGIVAKYERGEEMLVAIFHRPIHGEDFGTHRDYPCIVGQHRGHQVSVGDWNLVHVTDPTTCHCFLSRLDQESELPPVISAIIPHNSAVEIDHAQP